MKSPHRSDDNPCRPRHFKPPSCAPVAVDEATQQTLDTGRNRLLVTAGLFVVAFAVIALRLVDVTLVKPLDEAPAPRSTAAASPASRADIVDRNGVLLATTLQSPSLFADTRQIVDPRGATDKLLTALPDLSASEVYAKLSSGKSFVWLKRLLTPRQEYEVNRLGIPAFKFEREERRIYPQGDLFSHVVGYTSLDGKGLAGIERGFNDVLRSSKQPLRLSVDMRVQQIMRTELAQAVDDFSAKAGIGIVMDVRTGEVLAMVSLPDFDPNKAGDASPDALFNRATLGTYEMGSTFKVFTLAMALDDHVATLASTYDVSHPIRVGHFTIHDYHPMHRPLSLPEVLEYSSNIGAAHIAMDAGTDRFKDFLGRLGLLRTPVFEIPELGAPIVPSPWRDANTLTVAFGQGLAVSPLALATAASAIVNGGILHRATIVKPPAGFVPSGTRVVSARTSDDMRRMMRLVVADGTGEYAAAPGYVVGGKTGTAEKVSGRGYARHKLLSSFLGVFPINDPRYLVLAILDEPHGTAKTHGFATGGWTAAPVVGHVVARIAPILGVPPVDEKSPEIVSALAIDGVRLKKLASN